MPLTHQRRLLVRRQLRFFVNRYDVFALPSRDAIAFASKAHTAPEISVYRHEGGELQLRAAARLESAPAQGIEVTAADGTPLGVISIRTGLGRRRWHLDPPDRPTVNGLERSAVGSFFSAIFGWLAAHFDFTVDGQTVFTVHRRFGPLRRHVVDIADDSLDRRLVLAQVVALDAF